MAAIALRAVLTEMPVILVVTDPALHLHLHRARRVVMAIGALQLLVGAQERKMSLLGVIEGPNLPSVRRVAALATFAQRFMLVDEWAALSRMTLETSLICGEQANSAALECLRESRTAALNRAASVRIMAIGAAHLAFQYGVVMRQLEFCAHFQVALETSVG